MSAASSSSDPPAPVLLFDGDCGLCNRLVRLLLRLDRTARLRFAPLQGPAAQAFLRSRGLPTTDFDSLVFIPDWLRRDTSVFLLRSDGVIAALRITGRPGSWLAALLGCLPARWRDAGYRVVGRWRYRLFGPWRPRPLPHPEWSARFLG